MDGRNAFAERLLEVMDAKDHRAWGSFARGEIPLPRLEAHFRQEWEVYVRDFPVLLARVLGGEPLPANRARSHGETVWLVDPAALPENFRGE